MKIEVIYRGRRYYASNIDIDENGTIHINNCHYLCGEVDSEHVESIRIIMQRKGEQK